jgi:hypothetical protein
MVKLRTDIEITYDDKGNIKTLISPFDGDKTLEKSIFEEYYYNTSGSLYHFI